MIGHSALTRDMVSPTSFIIPVLVPPVTMVDLAKVTTCARPTSKAWRSSGAMSKFCAAPPIAMMISGFGIFQ